LLFQIGTISLLIFYDSISFLVSLSLVIVSFALSTLALFMLNQKIAKIMAEKNEIKLSGTKKNLLPFLFIHGLHIIMVALVSGVIFFMVRTSIISEKLPPSIYAFAFLLILILSIISPTFRIAKILASVRDSGIFQTLYDSLQFPKISLKRNLEISVLTFLIPLSIILASLNPLLNFMGSIFSSSQNSLSSIDVFIFISVLLIITVSFAFFSLNDIKATLHYEKLIQQYIDPPSLEWINSNQDDLDSDYRIQSKYLTDDFQETSISNRERRCPTCSAVLVEGAEFCTDCGKKVVI
ncbi:MAG: zinc ribbon domain-containing protein, partial [Candidatus Thorarchaeota archaeon]